jgi:hypothetical protein
MGFQRFFGALEINGTFGIFVKQEDVPEIPFSKEELEQAKLQGFELVLYVNKTEHGSPLTAEEMNSLYVKNNGAPNELIISNWYKHNSCINNEVPRPGWRLVTHDPEKVFTNKNYLEQTEAIIDKLRTEIFPEELPQVYKNAIDEFEASKDNYQSMLAEGNSDYETLGEALVAEKINMLCRETYTESIYRLTLQKRKLGFDVLNSPRTGINFVTTNSSLRRGAIVLLDSNRESFLLEDYGVGEKSSSLSTFFSRGV